MTYTHEQIAALMAGRTQGEWKIIPRDWRNMRDRIGSRASRKRVIQ